MIVDSVFGSGGRVQSHFSKNPTFDFLIKYVKSGRLILDVRSFVHNAGTDNAAATFTGP